MTKGEGKLGDRIFTQQCRRVTRNTTATAMNMALVLSVSYVALIMSDGALAQESGQSVAEPATISQSNAPTIIPPPVIRLIDTREIAAPSPPPPDANLPPVEPIISDSEFRRSIPAIALDDDPELSRPLESIAEFEQRQADETAARLARRASGESGADTDPDTTAVPVRASSDGVAPENVGIPVLGDAPIRDAELSAPLPPLDSFDVTPVTFAEAEDSSRNREVRYKIQLNGMGDAESSSEISMASLFKQLSALHDGSGKADNVAMLRARLAADGELLQRIMASEGYYDAAVSTQIDRGGANDPISATLNVISGARYKFSSINIEAEPTIPANLIADNFPLQVGEPIVAERVLAAEAAIALKLPEEGYVFAKIGQRDILLDGATSDGAYTLPVDIGRRARFGGVATTGKLAFDAAHVDLLARFEHGDLYDSRKVDDLRQALVATGLFSTVAAEAQPTGTYAEDGSEYVTMLVTQQAGPPRTLAGSIGYGTGEGLRVEGSWQHRNLFPPEGALIVRGVAGTQEQSLGVTMRRSNAGKRDRSFEVVAEALRSNYDAFEALTGRLGFRVSRESTPLWQKKLTYSFGADLIATREDDYDFGLQARAKDFYTILGLTGQLGMDRSDSLLDPTKGFRLSGLVQPEGSLAGNFTPYARTQIDGSAYYPVMDNLVIAGRIRVASILGADRERLAPSRRFYGGGGGSVRGFGYQQLGPKDPNNDPIGGRSLNEVAVEARYRFGNYGVVGFVDAGQVYTSSRPDFSAMRAGVGLGGRFYTNFGPMRLDVATPIGRKPGESRVSIYVSIGQAF